MCFVCCVDLGFDQLVKESNVKDNRFTLIYSDQAIHDAVEDKMQNGEEPALNSLGADARELERQP